MAQNHHEKIRHLLALAGGAANEAEAATAYALAQTLMTRHAIEAGELAEPAELTREDVFAAPGEYMPSWLFDLAHALAHANKCRAVLAIRRGSDETVRKITVYGPRETIAEVRSMFDYLRAQIDRFAAACPAARGKAGKRAFRAGAVDRIGERLQDAADLATAEAQARCRTLPEGAARTVAETGLALYVGQIARVDAYRAELSAAEGVRQTKHVTAPTRDAAAEQAGRDAAETMSFTARKALGVGA